MRHLRLVSMMAPNADPFYDALAGWLAQRGGVAVEIEDPGRRASGCSIAVKRNRDCDYDSIRRTDAVASRVRWCPPRRRGTEHQTTKNSARRLVAAYF